MLQHTPTVREDLEFGLAEDLTAADSVGDGFGLEGTFLHFPVPLELLLSFNFLGETLALLRNPLIEGSATALLEACRASIGVDSWSEAARVSSILVLFRIVQQLRFLRRCQSFHQSVHSFAVFLEVKRDFERFQLLQQRRNQQQNFPVNILHHDSPSRDFAVLIRIQKFEKLFISVFSLPSEKALGHVLTSAGDVYGGSGLRPGLGVAAETVEIVTHWLVIGVAWLFGRSACARVI